MVTLPTSRCVIGSGRTAPARFGLALMLAAAAPAPAQAHGQQRPAAQPVPDQQTLSKLLWSTMAAVDQANKTGNYSVLRDLGSSGFQANNNAASLAGVFAQIRDQRIDLSDTLVLAPTYEFAPTMVAPGMLRMRGRFDLRPTAIGFDLIYQWNQGWRLHGVAIVPFPIGRSPPAQR